MDRTLDVDYIVSSYQFLKEIDNLLDDLTRAMLRRKKIISPSLDSLREMMNGKLLLYVTLMFHSNFDEIEDYLPEELLEKVIKCKTVRSPEGRFSFENGKPFFYGAGLDVIQMHSGQENYPELILKTIRNTLAHSNYTVDGSIVKLRYRDMMIDVDVNWLLAVSLILFSNLNHSYLEGNSDFLYLFSMTVSTHKHFISLKKEFGDSYCVKLTLNKNAENDHISITQVLDYMTDLINSEPFLSFAADVSKIEKHDHRYMDKNPKYYNELVLRYHNMIFERGQNKFPYFDFEILPLDLEVLNTLNLREKDFYFRDLDKVYKASSLVNLNFMNLYPIKRNTLSFSYMLELLLFIINSEDKNDLVDSLMEKHPDFPMYLSLMKQFNEKAKMNLIFNYVFENTGYREAESFDFERFPGEFIQYKKDVSLRYMDVSKKAYNAKYSYQRQYYEEKEWKLLGELGRDEPDLETRNRLVPKKFRNAVVHSYISYPSVSDTDTIILSDYDEYVGKNYEVRIPVSELNDEMDKFVQKLKEKKKVKLR